MLQILMEWREGDIVNNIYASLRFQETQVI